MERAASCAGECSLLAQPWKHGYMPPKTGALRVEHVGKAVIAGSETCRPKARGAAISSLTESGERLRSLLDEAESMLRQRENLKPANQKFVKL